MVSQRMHRIQPILKHLSKLSDRSEKRYISTSHRELLDGLAECCRNILVGNAPLSTSQTNTLRCKKIDLRQIASKRTSLRNKRKILQRGGFLSAIITPILSLLGGLFAQNAIRS